MKRVTHSFRLRLAVSAALLASVALSGFAAIAWWHMYETRVATLDREFIAQAERELSKSWPIEHWPQHERNMLRSFNVSHANQMLFRVVQDDSIVYQSKHWPEKLNAQQLPWPNIEARPADLGSASHQNDTRSPPPPRPEQDNPNRPSTNPMLPAFTALSLDIDSQHWRIGLAATPREKLLIGVNLEVLGIELTELRNAFLLAAPLALIFIGFGAWFLSGSALIPLRRLSATMENITAKDLQQRFVLGNEDLEFRQLLNIFNRMVERLERSFLQASRFSADAAHELKTPLAILQGQLERTMSQCEPGSPIQARLTIILDEVQRLSTISRKLLLLSLADAGRLRLNTVKFDLSVALEDLIEDAEMLAPELAVSGAISKGLILDADPELLKHVLHNLLSNAIKYNLPNGWIKITARHCNNAIEVSISNASPGIPLADQAQIFERFYRGDPAHERQIEGVGLGLSLAREIVKAHGGDLRLSATHEGQVTFSIFFVTQITTL